MVPCRCGGGEQQVQLRPFHCEKLSCGAKAADSRLRSVWIRSGTDRSAQMHGQPIGIKLGGCILSAAFSSTLSRRLGSGFVTWSCTPVVAARSWGTSQRQTANHAMASHGSAANMARESRWTRSVVSTLGAALCLGGGSRNLRFQLPRSRVLASQATPKSGAADAEVTEVGNFVESLVRADVEAGKYGARVRTRFPPEPNGYLHIGHAKSICLNFGIARKFGGSCNLRFDDTNPASEKQEYIDSIQEDVRWLGFEWDGEARYASDYFDKLYSWAKVFIERDWAYVDELSAEELSQYRGTLTSPGKDSPFRNRPVAESLLIFERMRAGEVKQGAAILRAKIGMDNRNVIMRDPVMYRVIEHPPHPRTKSEWPVYPSYDWAHGLSDAIEEVTHSVCTLEFNSHNELYDWFNERVLSVGGLTCAALPRQHEFARLEMTYIVVSKRKLRRLVEGGFVDAWDDPRLPTLSGMRRRGYPPSALRRLCELIGVTKVPSAFIQFELLEACVRDSCKEETQAKLLCVLRPLRVVITNYDAADQVLEVAQEGEGLPARRLPFGREIVIDREDFMEVPEQGFKRLAPGMTAKLRFAYTITCDEVIHDDHGEVIELRCSYDLASLGQRPPKQVAVIHWAHATLSVPVRVRLYERLFTTPRPEEEDDFLTVVNPESVEVLEDARCEPSVVDLVGLGAEAPLRAQFERCGYFVLDKPDSDKSAQAGGPLVFNRTVTLNESWKPQSRR